MNTLYDIVGEFMEVYSLLSDPEADEQTILDTLEGISGELESTPLKPGFCPKPPP